MIQRPSTALEFTVANKANCFCFSYAADHTVTGVKNLKIKNCDHIRSEWRFQIAENKFLRDTVLTQKRKVFPQLFTAFGVSRNSIQV